MGSWRWISRDPKAGDIFKPQSINRYQFCFNNPVKNTDPDGKEVYVGTMPDLPSTRVGNVSGIISTVNPHTFVLVTDRPINQKGWQGTVFETGPDEAMATLTKREYPVDSFKEIKKSPEKYNLELVPKTDNYETQKEFDTAAKDLATKIISKEHPNYNPMGWFGGRNSISTTGTIIRGLGSNFKPKGFRPWDLDTHQQKTKEPKESGQSSGHND